MRPIRTERGVQTPSVTDMTMEFVVFFNPSSSFGTRPANRPCAMQHVADTYISFPFGEEANAPNHGPLDAGPILNRGPGLLPHPFPTTPIISLRLFLQSSLAGLFRGELLEPPPPFSRRWFSLGDSSVAACQHGLPVHQPPQTTPAAWSGAVCLNARRLTLILLYFTH
jgi:hypothetical protein